MKRLVTLLFVLVFLSGCEEVTPPKESCNLTVDYEKLVVEVNEKPDNYLNAVESNCDWVLNDENVNYTEPGRYIAEVTVTDSDADEATNDVPIIVEDTKKPEITVPDKVKVDWDFGKEDKLEGVIVTDNSKEEINITYAVVPTLNENEYEITLFAVDSSGNEGTFTFTKVFEEPVIPYVEFEVIEIDATEIEIKYEVFDPDNIVTNINLLVYEDGMLDSEQLMSGLANVIREGGLSPELEYEFEIEIETAEYTITDTLTLHTLPYVLPSYTYDYYVGTDYISAELFIEDDYNLITNITVTVDDGVTPIEYQVTDLEESHHLIVFEDLSIGETYELEYVVTYDVGSEDILMTNSVELITKEIDVLESVLSTNKILGDGEVEVQLLIDNPQELSILELTVNDQLIEDVEVYNSSITFTYIHSDDFLDETIFINEITVFDEGVKEIPINQDIEILFIDKIRVDGFNENKSSDYQINEMREFTIHLDNPSGYMVNSIKILGEVYDETSPEVLFVEDNTVIFMLPSTDVPGNDYIEVEQITYTVLDEEYTIDIVKDNKYYYHVGDFNNPVPIASCSDLYNITFLQDETVYYLASDIDCENAFKTPIETAPLYLNGNGHTISNITLEYDLVNAGLFYHIIEGSTFENIKFDNVKNGIPVDDFNSFGTIATLGYGVFKDITIEGTYILIDMDSSYADYGIVIGRGDDVVFDNVHVDVTLSIAYNELYSRIHFGGFAQQCNGCEVIDSSLNGSIEVTSHNQAYFGGFFAFGGTSNITRSYVNATLRVNSNRVHAGGMIAQGAVNHITDSYVAGRLEVVNCQDYCSVGGFIADVPEPVLDNVIMSAVIDVSIAEYLGAMFHHVGGFVSRVSDSHNPTITNSLMSGSIEIYGPYNPSVTIHLGMMAGDNNPIDYNNVFISDGSEVDFYVGINLSMINFTDFDAPYRMALVSDLMDPTYISRTILLDEHTWDLSKVIQGKYPKLGLILEDDVILVELI